MNRVYKDSDPVVSPERGCGWFFKGEATSMPCQDLLSSPTMQSLRRVCFPPLSNHTPVICISAEHHTHTWNVEIKNAGSLLNRRNNCWKISSMWNFSTRQQENGHQVELFSFLSNGRRAVLFSFKLAVVLSTLCFQNVAGREIFPITFFTGTNPPHQNLLVGRGSGLCGNQKGVRWQLKISVIDSPWTFPALTSDA